MRSFFIFIVLSAIFCLFNACKKQDDETLKKESLTSELPSIQERIQVYAPTDIQVDLSFLSERERILVQKLIKAGQLADKVFWKQTAPDAIFFRDSLSVSTTPEGKELYKYVIINYGPYDRIFEGMRFAGKGPEKKPAGANFYPIDLTKEEFESYIAKHPGQKQDLESQYTIVLRDGEKLKAVPFHQAYPEVTEIADKIDEAAKLADNPSLKRYLQLRAKSLRSDNYYESDIAWMELKDNNIDVIIGPIENYEDALFNYKTAYECAVVVKDPEGTKELQMFKDHIDAFERALPVDPKYIRKTAGSGNILEVMNVVYFGGDFQKGVKTIATSLPNDPRVTQVKGGKKQMFKNMMEAKFEKIVKPIAERILEKSLHPYVDKKAFTSFVTLHEVSHTLGRGYVYGNDSLSVRRALKERYSAIEECKADVLGIYNNLHLLKERILTSDDVKHAFVTYVAGLYRSLRFGAEEAHGRANLIQLNFLRERGAVRKLANGTFSIDEKNFFDHLAALAKEVLTIQAEGDYNRAGILLEKYGKMNSEIEQVVSSLKDIPRDLDTKYIY